MSHLGFKGRDKSSQRPHDKKNERRKNLSHKAKVQQFEERRRKAALYKYYKELKKNKTLAQEESKESPVASDARSSTSAERVINPYLKAKEELERRKIEKNELAAQRERERAERKEALEKYRMEKNRKFMKLRKKTKKGQPLMAGRMELLLEKIQKSVGQV